MEKIWALNDILKLLSELRAFDLPFEFLRP
jgi:hypothetical protein